MTNAALPRPDTGSCSDKVIPCKYQVHKLSALSCDRRCISHRNLLYFRPYGHRHHNRLYSDRRGIDLGHRPVAVVTGVLFIYINFRGSSETGKAGGKFDIEKFLDVQAERLKIGRKRFIAKTVTARSPVVGVRSWIKRWI